MTSERISINKHKPWGSVPEGLIEDTQLGVAARLVGAWLCIRPPGWILHRDHMLKTLGIGLDAWWRARRQLIDARYFLVSPRREGGRFCGSDLNFYSEPQPESSSSTAQGFPEPGKSEPGKSEPGKPLPLTRTLVPRTLKTKTQVPPDHVIHSLVKKVATVGGGIFVDHEDSRGQNNQIHRLSDVLRLNGPLAQDLDKRSKGATLDQLELLKVVYEAQKASGGIRGDGWLKSMAARAAQGLITGPLAGPTTEVGTGVGVSVADEISALMLPTGSIITAPVSGSTWRVVHEGIRNGNGLLLASPAVLKMLRRVHSGELNVSSPLV